MTPDERHRYLLNSKAKLYLTCALSKTQFDRVSECDTAKEMWNILVVAYEGTRKVKLARSAMLTIQFETFQMKEGESIEEMFSRLIIITNELKSLGTPITKLKKVQKLLGSLPDQWNAKVSAIEESKDLEELELDELMGILMVHEQKLEGRALLKKNNKSVAFKTTTELSTEEEQLSNDEDEEEDEMAFISKQIKKMWIARKNLSRSKSGRKFEPKKTIPLN